MREHKNQGLLTHLEIERRLLSIYSLHILLNLLKLKLLGPCWNSYNGTWTIGKVGLES
jgi:hypothetical protein